MKKKMSAEERAEFKNGKYMGGPAEEKAEKKKKPKKMAVGGLPEQASPTVQSVGKAPGQIGMGRRGRGRMTDGNPGRHLGWAKHNMTPGVNPGTPPNTMVKPPQTPLPPATQTPLPPAGVSPGQPPMQPLNPAAPKSDVREILNKVPGMEGSGFVPPGLRGRPGNMPPGLAKKMPTKMAKGGLVKGSGCASKGVKAPRYS